MKRGYKRLLKLADHLESDKRGHDLFDFGVYHRLGGCGTSGCGLGECPTLWKSWKFIEGFPRVKGMEVRESAEFWFELSISEAIYLFYPAGMGWRSNVGVLLNHTATAHEVAENMRAFVAMKVEEEG